MESPHLLSTMRSSIRCSSHTQVPRPFWMGEGDPQILLMFYKSFIRGIIDYGSILFANATESTLALLDRVQNQGLRLHYWEPSKLRPFRLLNTNPIFLHSSCEEFTSPNNMYSERFPILPTRIYIITVQLSIPRESRNLFPLYPKSSKSQYKIDRYPYKNLSYLEISHDWPAQ